MPKVGLDTPCFSPAYGLIADKKYFFFVHAVIQHAACRAAASHLHSHRTSFCLLKAALCDLREILKLNQTIGSQKVPMVKTGDSGRL